MLKTFIFKAFRIFTFPYPHKIGFSVIFLKISENQAFLLLTIKSLILHNRKKKEFFKTVFHITFLIHRRIFNSGIFSFLFHILSKSFPKEKSHIEKGKTSAPQGSRNFPHFTQKLLLTTSAYSFYFIFF